MTQRRMGSFFASLSRLYQASCLLRLRMTSPAKPSRLREAVAGSGTKYADMAVPRSAPAAKA